MDLPIRILDDDMLRCWSNLRKVLERPSYLCNPDYEPSSDTLNFIINTCKILVIGAGGLGSELLKDLALMGFRNIHVIDMDTIDLSNLNRQFLFRKKDIGLSKAEVAAEFINKRISCCNVTPHSKKIQDYDESFYRQFHIVISGLDSVIARRWINGMLLSMLTYNENGDLDQSTLIPLIDGGTEGFKGNARVIFPGISACIDCTLDLYPPQIAYPLCTIANTPRLPEHCIEYVKIIQWPRENPFGVVIDGDNPSHINWIHHNAIKRANDFNIIGVTYRLVQGVVKNIIPAVSSTNAVIAAACATEAFKLASSCYIPINNYMVFNDVDGIYTYTYEAEKREKCIACSQTPQCLDINSSKMKLQEVIDYLKDNVKYQMKSPGITAVIHGKNKTLYMPNIPSIEEKTRENLNKTLIDLGLSNDSVLLVADLTTPSTVVFKLKFHKEVEDEIMYP